MKITCIGSGAFALAITSLLSINEKNQISMWSHDEKWVQNALKKKILKAGDIEIPLKENIKLTTDYETALNGTDLIFILVNSKFIQDVVTELKYLSIRKIPILVGTKGFLDTKPYFFSQYIKKALKHKQIAFFAGPNLASDLAKSSPCVISVATKSKKISKSLAQIFPDFIKLEVEKNIEVIELASVLKNIYAMGAGMIYEKYPFSSTLLSYESLVFKELANLLYDKCNFEDLELYAGIVGDFFLTNTMLESRNFTYGRNRFKSATAASKYLKENTVEGYNNIESIITYVGEKKYPILAAIFKIIYKNEKTDILLDICFRNK